jgi:hypothetical protein
MDKKIVSLFIVTILLLTSFFLVSTTAIAQSDKHQLSGVGSSEIEHASLQKSMSYFTENRGQFQEDVRFVASTDFGKAVFYDSKVVYLLIACNDSKVIDTESITLTFPGSNLIQPQGLGVQSHKNNYFIGDSSHWVVGARNYQSIQFNGLWEGVDLVYKCVDGGMKYEFVVAPNVPVERIQVKVEGALLSTGDNSLILTTARGALTDTNLMVMQSTSKQPLPSSFIANDDEFSFRVSERDISQPLVIDPLIYSTYMGGSAEWGDWGGQVGVDSYGNAYMVGTTTSPDFPVKDSYQGIFGGGGVDGFIIKLNANGTDLIYSTFVGGSGGDSLRSIFVDAEGNVYAGGSTNSTDFPLVNPYQSTFGGGEEDGIVLKLNPEGDALTFSTYLGGNGSEGINGMSVDRDGNICMIGGSSSTNFPLKDAYQGSVKGDYDFFVLKLNVSSSSLVYSTYLGGSDEDYAYSIAVDAYGCAYVTGVTVSSDFPTVNPYQASNAGNGDIFISKFSDDGKELLYSTYLGSSNDESGYGIAVDASDCIYVTGYTGGPHGSYDFPLVNPIQSTYGGGYEDGFVLKLNAAGDSLIYSTLIGGSGDWEQGNSIVVDASGSAYVAGYTSSHNFPLVNATQSAYGGGDSDTFVIKIHPSGKPLLYSTYYGGNDADEVPYIALDGNGNFYVSGTTYSTNFPIYNAYQDHNNDWRNAFIFKFHIPSPPSIVTNVTAISSSGNVKLIWQIPNDDGGAPITGYRVYRGTSSGAETRLIELGNVLNYTDAPLTNGMTYFYKVSALNSAGEGPLSEELSSTPASVPTEPRGLRALSGDSVVELNWIAPEYAGPGTLTYHLFSNGSEIWSGTELAHSDNTVINGLTYSYSVAGNNSLGWGPNSSTVLATPMPLDSPPTAPLGLYTVPGNLIVELNWTEPTYLGPGTIIYHVFRDGALVWNGTGTSYVDENLVKGVGYSYQVAAQNDVGWGANSTAAATVSFGAPDAPWGLSAVPGNGNASLSWSAGNYSGPGTVAYHLFRDGVEVWSGPTTSHTDIGLTNGQAYVFKVSVSNLVGWSDNSSGVDVSPQGPPTSPRGLTVEVGDSYVELGWLAPTYAGPGALSYHLYRGGALIWSGTSQIYNDTSVINGVNYTYTVSAQNSLGWGTNSSSVSATPLQIPVSPGVPQNLQATAGDGEVHLTWDAPTTGDGEPVYHLFRDGVLVWSGYDEHCTDTGLNNGQTYSFKVSASNTAGWGYNSTEVSVTPTAPSPDGADNTMLYVGIGAVAILAVAGAAFMMMRKKK